MKRIERIKKAYDYSNKLTMQNEKYREKVREYFAKEMHEDLTGFGMSTDRSDITTKALFAEDKKVKAHVKAKEKGVIAGLEEVTEFYVSNGLEVKVYKQDGDRVNEGEKVMEVKGYGKDLLKLERTGLNFLQRMSGIATATRNLKDEIKDYDTFVVATRKSLDRYLDKKAVTLGGGLSHRLGLYDGILIKDNHLTLLKKYGLENVIEEAIERASKFKEHPNLKFVEIEVSALEDAVEAAENFKHMMLSDKAAYYVEEMFETLSPCIIMLDNMKPAEIRKTVDELKKKGLYDYVLLEASGGITEKNIEKYAKAGVDTISMGCLTHSVKALDLSQKIEN